MTEQLPRLGVGFITYGNLTAAYLPSFLESLAAQTYKNFRLIAFDNTPEEDNENIHILKQFSQLSQYSEVEIIRRGENLGFGKAYNIMLNQANGLGDKYFLMINPDTLCEPDMLEKLVLALESDESLSSVSPKIKVWDFYNKLKTEILDTCGLVLKPGLRFIDLGQAEIDNGQYDQASIIGPSGAAGLFRLSSLVEEAEKNNQISKEKQGEEKEEEDQGEESNKEVNELQFFDENFFMYKEDCDLVYRLHLAGFSSKLISDSVVYHDRTSTGGSLFKRAINRLGRSPEARRQAFLGQHFLWIKYWGKQSWLNKIFIIWQATLRFFAVLLFEQNLLSSYLTIKKTAKHLKRY